MKFNGMLSALIPGNFVGWFIHNVPNDIGKQVEIPRDYTVTGAEDAVKKIGVTIHGMGGIYFPEITGYEKLETAVFEIKKTGRDSFHVVKYIGELETKTTNRFVPKPHP